MDGRRSSCCFSPSSKSCSCSMSRGCSSSKTLIKRRCSIVMVVPACYLKSSLSQYLSSLLIITNPPHFIPSLTSLMPVPPSPRLYPPQV